MAVPEGALHSNRRRIPPKTSPSFSFRDRSDPGGDTQTMSRFSRAAVEAALSTASSVRRNRSTDVILASSKSALAPSARHWLRSGLSALASRGASVKVRVTSQVCACFIACRRRSLRRFAEVSDRACIARRPRMWSRPFALHATSAAAAPPLAGSRQTQVFVGVQSSASGVRLIGRRVRSRSSGMGM